ncbi:hypothetical protein INT45_007460 [Circinella minor]|uniref:ATP-dependent DNA helicase n=1 Tax=Circinella minor TaxID=1195481 RepID=A0A8H7VNR1_9FUNG|nr:hypothetical protein INT45_007460 [Circinella minor]
MSTSICNSCSLSGHQRISHRNCLNNANRLAISDHNETDERHQRITHRDCLNPNRLAIRKRNENDARDLEFIHESSEIAVPVCSSCGQEGSQYYPRFQQHDFTTTFSWNQERVSSSSLSRPRFNICCQQGSVQLPELSPAPTEIVQRLYANIDHTVANARGGAYNFRIHGSMYHRIGSLLPNENDNLSAEAANRHAVAPVTLNNVALQQLKNMMHRLNPFVTSFQSMAEVSRTRGIDNVRIAIGSENIPYNRGYNAPNADEIGILIVGNDGDENAGTRDIVLRTRADGLERISEMHRFYDALHYVLLFFQGDEGWTIDARSGTHKITVMEWYKYRLMVGGKPREDNYLHRSGKLFQQYIVDMYAKMEANRLGFICHNQSRLRAALYRNVADAMHGNCGKHVILPSSFIGYPRHMQQLYQDAMSIVRRFGKPDLFVTMTTNSRWPEIEGSLLPGQRASDHPDLTTHVFCLKLKELIDDLTKHMVLGKVIRYVDTNRSIQGTMRIVNPDLEHVPFGGKTVVFGGDFRQVLPVIPNAERPQIVAQCLNQSKDIWRHVVIHRLRTNMRVQQAASTVDANELRDFPEYLLRVDNGAEPLVLDTEDRVQIPTQMVMPRYNTYDLIAAVFGNLHLPTVNCEFLTSRAILTPKNKDVSILNSLILDQFPGDASEFKSADAVDDPEDQIRYPNELLNSLDPSDLPPHNLKLKVGCPIMLLRNLDTANGVSEIATGRQAGTIVLIPRITLTPSQTQSPIIFKRTQFPVRLAFSMTINKAQGQTFNNVSLYLPEPPFAHGLLYVAMSRVRTPTAIRIMLNPDNSTQLDQGGFTTRNVVYHEVLL